MTLSSGNDGLIEGEGSVYDEIFNRFQADLLGYFRKRGCGPDSEDLTQVTFVKVYKYLDRFRHECSFKTWLYTIAQSTFTDWVQKHRREKEIIENKEVTNHYNYHNSVNTGPLKQLIKSDLIQELEDALKNLPDQMRQCVYLRVKEDMKYQEIACVMKLDVRTVGSHLTQAKQRLRQMLDSSYSDWQF